MAREMVCILRYETCRNFSMYCGKSAIFTPALRFHIGRWRIHEETIDVETHEVCLHAMHRLFCNFVHFLATYEVNIEPGEGGRKVGRLWTKLYSFNHSHMCDALFRWMLCVLVKHFSYADLASSAFWEPALRQAMNHGVQTAMQCFYDFNERCKLGYYQKADVKIDQGSPEGET